MTIKLDLDRLDHHEGVPRGDTDAQVQGPSMHGAVTGHMAVGRYVLQIGEPCGALVREASRPERAHIRPRATPVLLRPRLIRGLLDRRKELAAALSALDAGLPVEVSGGPGIGKTAVLRHLAHHPQAASFADGVVYVPARHQSPADLLQVIFEAFYESDAICKPTEAEVQRGLQEKRALILLDDVRLPQDELEQVLDSAPRSSFVVATRERRLWGEVRSLALKGLPAEEAVLLLEREIERSLDVSERPAAENLCAAVEGHPLRVLQAAAIIREQGISLDGWATAISPASLITDLMASIDDRERRALLALTALPGVPLQAQQVAGIAELQDVEPLVKTLVRRGLVVSSQSRYHLADGVGDRLRRTEDLNPWVHRAITYFTAWAERYRRSPDTLLEESEALLRVQQGAVDARRWGEVLRLGRLLEGALAVGARWGAWAVALEGCLAAAKAIGDRSAEAWALHEIGTRAVCVGERGAARAQLSQAATLRESLHEDVAAAASRRNLGFVLAPVSDFSGDTATVPRRDVDLDSLPLRDDNQPAVPARKTNGAGSVLLTAMLLAILGGVAYLGTGPALSGSWSLASIGSFLPGGLGGARARTETPPPPPRAAAELRVLRFSAVPDRVAPGETVRLCYEVANGTGVRIDPGIGEVGVLRSNCVSATPTETTTYTLTAHGTGGERVSRTALVHVGVAASPESQPEGPGAVPVESEVAAPAGEPPPAPPVPRAPVPDRASILIFTARPGSIAGGEPTQLCYAVSGAFQVRIDPEIGSVNPASTLTCLRVAPARTTTYALTAHGRDGREVRGQLVIFVE